MDAALQTTIDFARSDTLQKCPAASPIKGYMDDFRTYIEETDWDGRLLKKYGKRADLFCWGVVIVSALFFFQISLSILFK